MTTARRVALAAAAVTSLALAGCSSGSSDDAASSQAPASAPAVTSTAPQSATGAAPVPTHGAPSDDTSSSAPAGDPATSSSQAPTSSAADSASAPPAGDVASKAQLVTLATKVGCADPKVIKPKSTSPAAKYGIPWALNCEADDNQYIIMAADESQRGKIMNSLMTDAWSSSKEVGYVADDGWMVIGGPKNSKTPPTKKDAVELQKKIGGSVEVATK